MIHIELNPDPAKSEVTDGDGNRLPVSSVIVSQQSDGPPTAHLRIELFDIIAHVESNACSGDFDSRTSRALAMLPPKVLRGLQRELERLVSVKGRLGGKSGEEIDS